jgi:hypothetical protein
MTTLLAPPFSLTQSTMVKVRVLGINEIGKSLPSSLNWVGAQVEDVPSKPIIAPNKNIATSQTSLVIDY